MNWKFISVLILIVILIFFIIFYPLQFDFYEDLKAKKLTDFIFIPFYGILVIYDIYRNIKKEDKNWKQYSIDFLKGTSLSALFYFLIMRRFFSCVLIFINCALGDNDTVKINGIIVNKIDSEGSGKYIGEYELTIDQNGKKYVLDSNHTTVDKYNVGEEFNIEMKKGILSILYK